MHIADDELRRRMQAQTDEDLRRIVANRDAQYTEMAKRAAAQELEERGASGRHVVEEPLTMPNPVKTKRAG